MKHIQSYRVSFVRITETQTLWTSEMDNTHTQCISIQTCVSTSHWEKMRENSSLTYASVPFHLSLHSAHSEWSVVEYNVLHECKWYLQSCLVSFELSQGIWYYGLILTTSKLKVNTDLKSHRRGTEAPRCRTPNPQGARHRTPNCSPGAAASAAHCSKCVCTWMG